MQETRARVLSELHERAVSGPELADELGISRAAIWKQIEALRSAGFEIESTNQGYELRDIPEFGGHAVEFGLDLAYSIHFEEQIESTNTRARELAEEGKEDVVVLANEQTGGRGRLEREWESPAGGVWLSILTRPDVPPTRAPLYTLGAAVATARAIREAGAEAQIKWPNDLLIDGKKVAGILTEMEGEADRVSWLITGIGINANIDPETLPDEQPATTLQAEIGNVNRRDLVQRLLEEFHTLGNDPDSILPAWRELSVTLGQVVKVETAGETVQGTAVDVTDPGTLLIEAANGEQQVSAGDCEHLRPATQ